MTDNTISNYPLSSLILRVVYSQFCKARLAHRKRVTICMWPLTSGPLCK